MLDRVVVRPADPRSTLSSDDMARHQSRVWWFVYVTVGVVGLAIAAIAYKRSAQLYLGICLIALLLLWAAWTRFPRTALACTIFLALVGDLVTVFWFPFNKNLSSQESIFYIADAVSVSPLELTVVWGLAVTAFRSLARTGRLVPRNPLGWAFAGFVAFVAFGFAYGLARGGDTRAAIFELRPLLLFPLLYLLVLNVCRSRRDYRLMLWAALAAIVVQSLLSLLYLERLEPGARAGLESLNEHGSAIGMNLLFLATILSLLTPGISARVRWTLSVASVPVMWVYLVSERRAAVIALGAGLILVAVRLFWSRRRTFWRVIPIATLLVTAYTAAFWNTDSSVGFPAQAIKSVVAADQLGAADQSSDLYREIEKYDISQTIRSSPVTGLGFGQPFLRPVPLPDIGQLFEFSDYVPHNSLLWIWIKTGFGGFVALLYLLSRSISSGAARMRSAPAGIDEIVTSCLTLFIVMYSVFLYVDIAWEPRNVMLLALAMAMCTGRLDDESDGSDRLRAERPKAGSTDRRPTERRRLTAV